jgi:regulator of sigma E protease
MELLLTGANVLLVLLGFGLLILVHEAGHFIAARWAGIRTDAFAIGFGPVLCAWRKGVGFRFGSCDRDVIARAGRPPRALTDAQLAQYGIGETEYSLRWLPLGGFVRMLGQDDLDPTAVSSDPRAFNSASIGRRMVVISAGVIMNLVLAATLFVVAFSIGVDFEAPVVGDVKDGSSAEKTLNADNESRPLLPGDHIIAINGTPVPTFADVQVAAAMSVPGETMQLQIRRGEEHLSLHTKIQVDPASELPSLGISPAASTTLIDDRRINSLLHRTLKQVSGDSAPSPGWTLDGVGPSLGDLRHLSSFAGLEALAMRTKGQPFAWSWRGPDGSRAESMVSAQPQWDQLRYVDASSSTPVGWELGLIGLVPMVEISSIVDGGANDGVLKSGDLILEFGGIKAPRMRGFRESVGRLGLGSHPMKVERDGVVVDLEVRIVPEGLLDRTPKLQIYPGYAWDVPRIARPMIEVALAGPAGTPASISTPVSGAQLSPGARFIVQGEDGLHPWRRLWEQVQAAVRRGDMHVVLSVAEGGAQREVELPLDELWRNEVSQLQWQPPLAAFWFEPLQVERSSGGNPLRAITMGLHETWNFIVLTYVTIDRLFRGTVGVSQLHGPVGIVHLGSRIADRGIAYMLFFLALISVNLAVLNFLPLPIVDGGLMLYLVYEKFKGRPPSLAFQNGAALIGLMLIGSLFLVTFYNDLLRLLQ